MEKNLFRSQLIKKIDAAINESRDAMNLGHKGMTGRVRENLAKNLFEPLLPLIFSQKTNVKIIDQYGFTSNEIDLVIYSKNLLPPVLYAEEITLIPAESSFFAIEIKSMANATEIKKTYNKAKKLRKLKYQTGIYVRDIPQESDVFGIVPAFFAFNSDLTKNLEINRYEKIDQKFNEDPILRIICVLGKGCWAFNDHEKKWYSEKPSNEYDEVILFLSLIINSLHESFVKRGYPRLGVYLSRKKKNNDTKKINPLT